MDYKEIIASISESENLPAGQVRKSLTAFLNKISSAIENGENVDLPIINFRSITQAAIDAAGETPARPERKIAVLRVRSPRLDINPENSID